METIGSFWKLVSPKAAETYPSLRPQRIQRAVRGTGGRRAQRLRVAGDLCKMQRSPSRNSRRAQAETKAFSSEVSVAILGG